MRFWELLLLLLNSALNLISQRRVFSFPRWRAVFVSAQSLSSGFMQIYCYNAVSLSYLHRSFPVRRSTLCEFCLLYRIPCLGRLPFPFFKDLLGVSR